jgi:TonB family protein
VLDVSPFPRTCVGEGGCVLPMGGIAVRTSAEPAAPPVAAPPASPAPAEPPAGPIVAAPRSVTLDKLHRQSGQPEIAPSDDAKKAAAGKPFAVAIVKVCLTADGRVASTKLAKSSGVPAYDKQLQTTIEATWAFEPYATDGAPEPACASATFVSHRNVPGGP